jgi:Zn-dependent M28 family amino/carboxypeptidase
MAELLSYTAQGYKIHMKTAFTETNYTARNIVGYIPAVAPTNECLIISAHMDHLSPDPDGVLYPGALDNASGTAAVIELARTLKRYSAGPKQNLVFVAFAGEEMMMQGSEHYAKHPVFPSRTTRVLNMDMVGAAKDLPLTVMTLGNKPEGSVLYDELRQAATDVGRVVEELPGAADDHVSFKVSTDAVTLIDYDTEHANTPADDMHTVGEQNFRADMQIMLTVIQELAYKN